jgi:ABC-2 type transport system permease protein
MIRGLPILTFRLLRSTLQMPFFVAITTLQPLLWLFLFGSIMGSRLGSEGSYAAFLLPGVAVMSAFYSSAYAGFAVANDLRSGALETLRIAPVDRLALPWSYVGHATLTVLAQVLAVQLVGSAMVGAHALALGQVLPITLTCLALALAVGGLSVALAFATGTHEALLSATNLLALPLLFLSSFLGPADAMPAWMQFVANGNPLHWAMSLAKGLASGLSTSTLIVYAVLLAALAVLGPLTAAHAFQRALARE